MHLIEKYIIKKNHPYYKDIDDLYFKSKNLYNKANYIVKQEFINNKNYIDYFTLQKMLQNNNDTDNILRKVSTNGDRDITNVVEDLRVSPVRLNIGDNPVYLTKLIK